MSAKTARRTFYLGTLIFLVIFLGLTLDTHRQVKSLTHSDQASEQEQNDLVAFLQWTSQIDTNDWPPRMPSSGGRSERRLPWG